MKKYSLLFCLLALIASVKAQNDYSDYKSHVVIGAFEQKSNAETLLSAYQDKGFAPSVIQNNFNKLHYVVVFSSENLEESRSKVFAIRDQFPELVDTWLYNGNFSKAHLTGIEFLGLTKATEPEAIEEPVRQEANVAPMNDEPAPMKEERSPVAEPVLNDGEYKLFLRAINEINSRPVMGEIEFYDGQRNRLISRLPANESLVIKEPKNGTHVVKFVSDIFGFRPEEYTFDLDEPENNEHGQVEVNGDSITVNFNLVRFNKGDFMTMWRVYFYIDAAIMKEESVAQLNQLLSMMQENENMRLRIHGHTNGNSKGEVLHLDLDDKNFFSLNGTHEKTPNASAKKLSLYRAYTIQHWLMDQGIAENRMEIKGWGGKKMIYDKHDSQADKNVRVEIEILEE
ncbi:MAG: OmpA family protein [Bacteroidota bacterium]